MTKIKTSSILTTLVIIASLFTGCNGASQSSVAGASANASTEITSVESNSSGVAAKIKVGTGNAFKPVCYLDEDGNLAGMELEILTEVDKRLPEYKFEFETYDFANILLSLESGKIDLAAHYYAKNAERVEKYLYTEEGYTSVDMRAAVDNNRTDINSVDDLKGKKVYVPSGSNAAYLAEQYNKAHDNALNLQYGTQDNATIVQSITNGTIDAFFSTPKTVNDLNTAYGEKLKLVGDPVYSSETYYIVNKKNEKLKEAIDGAIKSMKEDGTLAEIVTRLMGADSVPDDAKAAK